MLECDSQANNGVYYDSLRYKGRRWGSLLLEGEGEVEGCTAAAEKCL